MDLESETHSNEISTAPSLPEKEPWVAVPLQKKLFSDLDFHTQKSLCVETEFHWSSYALIDDLNLTIIRNLITQ
jgi:hypothetical protein